MLNTILDIIMNAIFFSGLYIMVAIGIFAVYDRILLNISINKKFVKIGNILLVVLFSVAYIFGLISVIKGY